jgi:hypothetical protein
MMDPSLGASLVTKSAKSLGIVCFYGKEDGHLKRNCNKYQDDKAKSGSVNSDLGTLIVNAIGIYIDDSPSNSWVYDTRSVIHVHKSM